MKIDPWDKLQALKHSDQYKKDYLTWFEESEVVGSIYIIPNSIKSQGSQRSLMTPELGLGVWSTYRNLPGDCAKNITFACPLIPILPQMAMSSSM
jgi:hypothetical protein